MTPQNSLPPRHSEFFDNYWPSAFSSDVPEISGKWPALTYGLRFMLSYDVEEYTVKRGYISMFLQAYQRLDALLNATFTYDQNVGLLLRFIDESKESSKGFKEMCKNRFSRPTPDYMNIVPHHYDKIEGDPDLFEHNYYFDISLKSHNIQIALWYVLGQKIGIKPSLVKYGYGRYECFLIDPVKRIIVFLWDDRGVWIDAENKKLLRKLYRQFQPWLNDWPIPLDELKDIYG